MSIEAIIAIIQALLRVAPQVPEIIAGAEAVLASLKSGNAPTPEQQAQIDAMLDASHKDLQS